MNTTIIQRAGYPFDLTVKHECNAEKGHSVYHVSACGAVKSQSRLGPDHEVEVTGLVWSKQSTTDVAEVGQLMADVMADLSRKMSGE